MIQDFFTGLQFLTRFRLVKQTEWSPEGFGRSVRHFPLVGAALGAALALCAWGLLLLEQQGVHMPPHPAAALLLLLSVALSGGLTCDGFMDTMDGVFSGRDRARMLEIMKDSRVGANGVMAFCLLMLCKWSLLLELGGAQLVTALFVMPMLSRTAMVAGITLFPYARPEGIGKAFAQYAGKKALCFALFWAALCLAPCGAQAWAAAVAVAVFTALFCRYVTAVLGGLTGDVYGALTELSELIVLAVFLF